jgi:hypothetical protein
VEYIKKILKGFQLHDPLYGENYKELFEVFGTTNKDMIPRMIKDVDTMTMHSVTKNIVRIQSIIEGFQESADENVNGLQEHIQYYVEQLRNELIHPLQTLYYTIDTERTRRGTIPFKKEFIKLGEEVTDIITWLEKTTCAAQLLEYKYTKGVSDILGFTAKWKDIVRRRTERNLCIIRQREQYHEKNKEAKSHIK